MAVDITKVKCRAGVVSVGDYVTAKGAGTLVDVGLTKGGVTIGYKPTYHAIEGDQHLGELAGIPTKREIDVKFAMSQTEAEKFRLAMEQPAGNVTGTLPNQTFLADANSTEQYHQVSLSIAGGGVGTTGLRLITFWRCVFTACDPIGYKKDNEQMYAVTMRVYQELTGTGNDTFFKQVDT